MVKYPGHVLIWDYFDTADSALLCVCPCGSRCHTPLTPYHFVPSFSHRLSPHLHLCSSSVLLIFFLCWLGRHTLSAFLPGCWLCSSITPCLLCFLLPPLHPCSLCLPLWGLSASLLSRLLQLLEQRSFLTLQGYAAGITLPCFAFLSLPSHSALLAVLSSQAAAEDKTGAGQKDGVSAFNYCIVPFVFSFFKQLKNRASTTGQRGTFFSFALLASAHSWDRVQGRRRGRDENRLQTAYSCTAQCLTLSRST